MPFIYWLIPLFLPKYDSLFEDHLIPTSGCMWRMWTHSRGQKGSLYLSWPHHLCFHLILTARQMKKKSKEILSKQWCKAAPTLPPSSSLPSSPRFQTQRTVILVWALRAKHLLRFVSQSFSSPRGRYGSQERNRCRNVVERPTAGACFHYLKPSEFREQKEMWMEKTYLSSGGGVQPTSWMIFFFFRPFFCFILVRSRSLLCFLF